MTAGDVMVTDGDKEKKPEPGSGEAKEETRLTVAESLKAIVLLIDNCVKTKDTRLLSGRLHRLTATIRLQLSSSVLTTFIQTYLVGADAASSKEFLLSTLQQVCSKHYGRSVRPTHVGCMPYVGRTRNTSACMHSQINLHARCCRMRML